MAGIDLHSNNMFCGIVDMEGKRVFEKKLPCEIDSVARALKPFKKRLERIAVESTYNWYWLVDGLQDRGYPVVLANPAAMRQYDGLKHADDKIGRFFFWRSCCACAFCPPATSATGNCVRCGTCCGGGWAWCTSAPVWCSA